MTKFKELDKRDAYLVEQDILKVGVELIRLMKTK